MRLTLDRLKYRAPDEPPAGGPDPNPDPNATPPATPPPATPAPLTDEQRREIALTYAQANPDEFRTPAPTPPDPDPDPADPPQWIFDQDLADKTLDERVAAGVAQGVKQVLGTISPLLKGFAEKELVGGLPEAARPYLEQIAKEQKVDIAALALSSEASKLASEAAIGRAFMEGKLVSAAPESGEGTGGGNLKGLSTAEIDAKTAYESVVGRELTPEETKTLLSEVNL